MLRLAMEQIIKKFYNCGRVEIGEMVIQNGYNVILTTHSAFNYIQSMTMRRYYFEYRKQLSFLQMSQAILFDHIPENISKRFSVEEKLPNGFPWLQSTVLRNQQIIRYEQYNNFQKEHAAFPTASDYFNFLTCHGLSQRASAEYFLQHLDVYIWSFLGVTCAAVCLLLLLSAHTEYRANNLKVCFYVKLQFS